MLIGELESERVMSHLLCIPLHLGGALVNDIFHTRPERLYSGPGAWQYKWGPCAILYNWGLFYIDRNT